MLLLPNIAFRYSTMHLESTSTVPAILYTKWPHERAKPLVKIIHVRTSSFEHVNKSIANSSDLKPITRLLNLTFRTWTNFSTTSTTHYVFPRAMWRSFRHKQWKSQASGIRVYLFYRTGLRVKSESAAYRWPSYQIY